MERISYIRKVGPKLIDLGYLITEIGKDQKFPLRRGWTKPLTKEGCRHQAAENGVGILCGVGEAPIVGIDVDFAGTEDESRKLRMALYDKAPALVDAICRVGRPPRFLLAVRASEEGWTKGASRWLSRPGDPASRSRLELLGKGQQFVAYHIHPDTGKPYEYPFDMLTGEFENVRADSLPVITLEDADKIIEAFEEKMQDFGFVPESGVGESPMKSRREDDFLIPEFRPVGLTIEEARTLLEENPGLYDVESYDGWREIGMRLHHEFQGSEEGLELYDDVSSKASSYKGFEDVRRKWMSFGKSTGRKVTMWPLAKAARIVDCEELSERGLVKKMIRYAGNSITVLRDTGEWAMFDKELKRWNRDAEPDVYGFFFGHVMDEVLKAEGDEAEEKGDTEYAEAVRAFRARCMARYGTSSKNLLSVMRLQPELNLYNFSDFDKPREEPLLLCGNGVLNLVNGSFTENEPDLLLLRRCNADYDPEAESPLWEKCLMEWLGDAESVRYVQDVFGQALGGVRKDNIFIVLVGGGANGKSTFLTALQDVLGTYAAPIAPEVILSSRSGAGAGGPRPEVLALAGARFALCSETDDGLFMKEADLKRFTGNDDVTARGMYARRMTVFRPQFLPVLSTNHEPAVRGTDEAIWRRIRKVEFPFNFAKDPGRTRDPNLAERLKMEASGILNWLIAGYRRAQNYPGGEVPLPKAVRLSTDEYRSSQDLVGSWVKDAFVHEAKSRIPMRAVYEQFQADMKAQGEDRCGLTQRGLSSELRRILGKDCIGLYTGRAALRGWRLKTDEDRAAEREFGDFDEYADPMTWL